MSGLISKEDVSSHLSGMIRKDHIPRLKTYLLEESPDETRSQSARNWLSWTSCQSQLRSVTSTVPAGILPSHVEADLTDVKVHSRGPDDKVYDANPKFRRRVARGNCVMELRDSQSCDTYADCVIFALKKFTGGLGDDDDRDIDDGFKFQKYFVRPIGDANRVICTRKMNGEAAHFAVRWLYDRFYVIAGSKNVHLLYWTKEDIQKYSDTRYLVARDVATSCCDFFDAMDPMLRNVLFSFFHHTKFTAVLEILQPTYQHVEDLSYLSAPKLFFISWSKTDMEGDLYEEDVCIPPDFGQEVARAFKLAVTGYDTILHKDLSERLTYIRKGHGYEGEVLYFVDSTDKVIGLLKKKTVWYIIVRAIREKAKNAVATMRKNPSEKFDLADSVTRTRKRLKEIQKWLGLDQEAAAEWEEVAVGFLKWLMNAFKEKKIKTEDLFGLYPVVWNKYLKETGRSDVIGLSTVTLVDDPDVCCDDGGDDASV